MSFASYPWNSSAEIRAHYAKRREDCHARYERESTAINREEQATLDEFRQIAALAIEAATAGETTKIGSTEGESAGPKDNAQNMSGPSHE